MLLYFSSDVPVSRNHQLFFMSTEECHEMTFFISKLLVAEIVYLLSMENGKGCLPFEDNCLEEGRSDIII